MPYVHGGVPLDEPVEHEIRFVFWDKVAHQARTGDRLGLRVPRTQSAKRRFAPSKCDAEPACPTAVPAG
jgi:hypothetical protein